LGNRNSWQRAREPLHVAAEIDDPPSPDLAHLVDPVGKLIAAVLDMDRGLRERKVAAVDVGDAGQSRARALIDAERLELAVECGTLHAHELGGARDVAAEAAGLCNQILAVESLACF